MIRISSKDLLKLFYASCSPSEENFTWQIEKQIRNDMAIASNIENSRFVISSDPFDLQNIQNEQVINKTNIPFRYINKDQFDIMLQGESPVEITLANLSNAEIAELERFEISEASDSLEDVAKKAPVVRLVNAILKEASQKRASDIHIDPTEKGVSLRYRIDGVLYEQVPPPRKLYLAIISRIKILAGINIAEKRLPQDGRIRLNVDHGELDIRVATIPSIYGESVALRLLDKSIKMRSLTELGLSDYDLQRLQQVVRSTSGIILVTGPTGSGKTTTLYAMLQEIRSAEHKILTLEDPVEYEIPGITQIQVKPKIGFGFADGLRSLLRHDPDVILVGEIRDRETAEMAIHASLTGHLVLSSLHTNDAPGAITRLLDMGIEPFLLATSLRGVLAQRLVRLLCNVCAGYGEYNNSFCAACDGTGFRGRSALYELMICNDSLKDTILVGGDNNALKKLAKLNGMMTMAENGSEKVEVGLTSHIEIQRVLGSLVKEVD